MTIHTLHSRRLTGQSVYTASVLIAGGMVAVLVSAFYPVEAAALLVVLVIAVLLIAYPVAGLLCMMGFFLIQDTPLYTSYGYGVLSHGASAADVVGLVIVLAFLLRHHRGDNASVGFRLGAAGLIAVAAFSGWEIASSIWSNATTASLVTFIRNTAEGLILFALALLFLRTPSRARLAAAAYVTVGLGLAVYTVLHFHQQAALSAFNSSQAYRGGLNAAANPNVYAIELAVVPFLALFAVWHRRPVVRLAVGIVVVPIIVAALIVLASRESYIAFAAGLLAAAVITRSNRSRLIVGFLIVAIGAAVFAAIASHAVPAYVLGRFSETGLYSVQNFGGRLPTWRIGLQLWANRPVFGLGAVGLESAITSYHVNWDTVTAIHSDYLRALIDSGIIGLIALLAMLAVLGLPILRRRDPMLIAVYVILVVAMNAGDFLLWHQTWVALSIMYCCAITLPSPAANPARARPFSSPASAHKFHPQPVNSS